MEEEGYYTTNVIARIIKILAIIYAIFGIIACIWIMFTNAKYIIPSIIGLFSVGVITVFIYAIGEGIEIMHDIRRNSEHIRDYLENKEK